MARFDVLETVDGALVVDCQADFFGFLKTRFVVPLLPPELEPKVADRLNPVLVIDNEQYVFYTQFAAAMSVAKIRRRVTSVETHHIEIMDALDMLISGY